MAKYKTISGTIIGFMPMAVKKMPTIRKIESFHKDGRSLALNIHTGGMGFPVQAYFTYRVALALSRYISKARIPLKVGTKISVVTYVHDGRDTVYRIKRLDKHYFKGVKDAKSYAKKTEHRSDSEKSDKSSVSGSDSSSTSSSSASSESKAISSSSESSASGSSVASDSKSSEQSNASSQSSSSASVSRSSSASSASSSASSAKKSRAVLSAQSKADSASSAKSVHDRSATQRASSSASSVFDKTAGYKSLISTDNQEKTSEAYHQLLSVSDSSLHSGLAKAYKQEGWKKFLMNLNTHAGKAFHKDIYQNDTKDRMNVAMRYNKVPVDFNNPQANKKKPKKHYSNGSIKLW